MSIVFKAPISSIESYNLIKLPLAASEMLSSRGMVMIEGTINNINFQVPLEPDGNKSHWFEIDDPLYKKLGLNIGDLVDLNIEVMNDWTEPAIPQDIMDAISQNHLLDQWESLTPKARWSWLRWIRSTKNITTRQKRIEVTCSKLQKGNRRPCCFDETKCTITEVSKNGILL